MMYMVWTGVLITWLFFINSSEGSQVMIFDFRELASLSTTEQHQSQLTSAAPNPPQWGVTLLDYVWHREATSSHRPGWSTAGAPAPQNLHEQAPSLRLNSHRPTVLSSPPHIGHPLHQIRWHFMIRVSYLLAELEGQTGTTLTGHPSQTQLSSWRREQARTQPHVRTNC